MILLVGASASGKTEIAKYLREAFGITKAITHTTRAIRPSETKDVDYHFVDKETFLRLKEEDAFVETTEYNGNFYGCSKAETGDDKCIILDPSGIKSFLALNNPNIVTFFLRTSPKTRKERMLLRGDDPSAVESRLRNDETAFAPSALPHINFVLDCDEEDVKTIGDKIHSLYLSKLKQGH